MKKEQDFERAVGKHVHVTTYEPINGSKVFEGELVSYDGKQLEIKEAKASALIPRDKVASARLAIVF
ncbi:Ribosome maturation factor RimP [compost metagenome]